MALYCKYSVLYNSLCIYIHNLIIIIIEYHILIRRFRPNLFLRHPHHLQWRLVHHLVEVCEKYFPWSASSSFTINKPGYYHAFQIIRHATINSITYEPSLSIMIGVFSYDGIPLYWLPWLSRIFLAFFCRTMSPVLRAFSSCPHLLSTFHTHIIVLTISNLSEHTFSLQCQYFSILAPEVNILPRSTRDWTCARSCSCSSYSASITVSSAYLFDNFTANF